MKTPWGFLENPMKYGCPRHARPGAVERAAVNNSFGQWCSKHVPRQFSDVFMHASCSRGRTQRWYWHQRLISSMPRRVEACVEDSGSQLGMLCIFG